MALGGRNESGVPAGDIYFSPRYTADDSPLRRGAHARFTPLFSKWPPLLGNAWATWRFFYFLPFRPIFGKIRSARGDEESDMIIGRWIFIRWNCRTEGIEIDTWIVFVIITSYGIDGYIMANLYFEGEIEKNNSFKVSTVWQICPRPWDKINIF